MWKMVAALIHLLLLLLLSVSAAGVSIGSTIYLPESNLGVSLSPVRNSIFEGNISSFLRSPVLQDIYHNTRHQLTSDSVFGELGATFGLSVLPIEVLRFSLGATFRFLASSQANVSSALILVESYSKRQVLLNERSSLQKIPLRNDFLRELRDLPEPPFSVTADEDWVPYREFLIRWGSHYVSEVYYGSWLRTWSTAASSKSYTALQLQAKACAALTGVASIPAIEACANIDLGDMAEASRLDMNVQVEVRGGEPGTRAQLSVHRTDQLIRDFIEEGQKNEDAVVKYSLLPIWRPVLAQYRSPSTKEWKVATALEGYYNGYLAFSCPYIALSDPLKVVLQQFRRAPNGNGTYECVRQCQGCKRDRDCHLRGIGCYCYGRTCVAAPEGRARNQTSPDRLPRNVPPNVNCQYSFPSCKCHSISKEANCGTENLIPIWKQASGR